VETKLPHTINNKGGTKLMEIPSKQSENPDGM